MKLWLVLKFYKWSSLKATPSFLAQAFTGTVSVDNKDCVGFMPVFNDKMEALKDADGNMDLIREIEIPDVSGIFTFDRKKLLKTE